MQIRPITSTLGIYITETALKSCACLLRCLIVLVQAIWNKTVGLLHAIFCRTNATQNRESAAASIDLTARPQSTTTPSSPTRKARGSEFETSSECEELITSEFETSSECEQLSDSENETFYEPPIETKSSQVQLFHTYTTPESRKQLIADFQNWLQAQRITPKKPKTLKNLKEAASTNQEISRQFACINRLILETYPNDYDWFSMIILSKLHTRLEEGLAIAVETGAIEPLISALRS